MSAGRSIASGEDLDPIAAACATPFACIDRDLAVRAMNAAMHDWIGAGTRPAALSVLDARPPSLGDAVRRAFADERRVWLREARLRTAIGDRVADVAVTPIDGAQAVLEVLPALGEASGATRWSESLRGFAHEVRGPLAGMRGAAQLLQRRIDDAATRELADLVVAEVDRLATLAERLLQAGGKPRLAVVNVHEVLERVAALARTGDAAPDLRRDYDPSLPAVRIDGDRILQALLNLVRNAIEAGATQVVLRTRAEHAARIGERVVRLALRIDVVDDGGGVPAALAATLFEPMVSGRADGSGLGLAIAREIAREHGGDVVHAGAPGATTFSLLLPAVD